jgi:hypothetical protein
VLARTLWDTGCSHELVSPEFANELMRKGGRWRECAPLHLNHGDSEHVTAGAPATRQVCANILLVHKGKFFEQNDVWLHVYEGSLPDVMLSESFLNNIPCISHPGTKLIDTAERLGDLEILRQCVEDYSGLVVRRFTHPEVATSRLHFAAIHATINSLTGAPGAKGDAAPRDEEKDVKTVRSVHEVEAGGSDRSAGRHCSSQNRDEGGRPAERPGAQPNHGNPETGTEEQGNETPPVERKRQILKEMQEQRERLRLRLGKPVSAEALQRAEEVLNRYPKNFRPQGKDACKLAVFRIKLKDNTKFHIALPRRANPIVMADMRRQVQELLEIGAIERCQGQPSSVYAVVMVRKPGQPGKWRLCIDLQGLNANTVPMPYAMPDVHEALDRLSGKKYYSSFDFTAWFQQFDIAEEDREKVAFVIPGDGLTPPQMFQWRKMCFGLLNAGYWSQRQLQEALEKFEGCGGIYPFVDDIVIASDTLEEHLEKLEAFMKFCEHYNIRIKREKVELVTGAVKHLGFILSEEGQALDPARIDSLLAIGAPSNLKGLKSLLGSFSFIRGWIAGMADTAAPLTDLMGAAAKRLGFQWGPAQEAALEALKESCQLAPALGSPDYSKTFHVSMDASDVGVGAVLWQWQTNEAGELIPQAIMYASRRFSDRERRWEISIREMYAVRYALEKFKAYLQGYHDVVLHTDHMNLVTGMYTHTSPKIERWRMFIESFRPFRIQHVRGDDRTQLVADGLSRLHVTNLALNKTPDELDSEALFLAEQGEGGMDEVMFDSHTGTAAHAGANYPPNGNRRRAKQPKTLTAATQQQILTSMGCERVVARGGDSPSGKGDVREERRRERYGRGFDLVKDMGWSIEGERHRKMGWEQVEWGQEGCRPGKEHRGRYGIGYRCQTNQTHTCLGEESSETTPELEDVNYLGTIHLTKAGEIRFDREHDDENGKHPVEHATKRYAAVNMCTRRSKHAFGRITNRQTTGLVNVVRPAGRTQRKTKLNLNECDAARLITATSAAEIVSKPIDKRHRTELPTGTGEEEDRRRALGAKGTCNQTIESQTNVEDFRQAGRLWRGGFPDEELIRRCHDDSHPSFPVTWRRVVRATGIGPGLVQAKLKEQVRRACDACLTCQKLQPARKRVAARIGSIKKRPFGELAFDVITLNTEDVDGNNLILTVIDNFSHAVELFPLKRATAEAVTICLHDVLCRWGRPHQVRCDNAKAFAALVTKQLLQRAKVKQHFCAPYSHNSNGKVENANRRVMEVLRAMILDDRFGANTRLQWSLLLPAVRRIIMSRTILQYGCCPNDIAYMFSPENEMSIFDEEPWMPPMQQEPAEEGKSKMIEDLRRQHEILVDACERKLDEHLEKLATLQEMAAEDIQPLQPGDFVLVDMRERPHCKIQSPWSGPWQVVEHDDNDPPHPIVWLQHIANKRIERFNASMIKRCNLDLFEKVDEAIKFAAADSFEYEVEAVLDHKPRGERKRRRKDTYEFQVLWRGIERSEDNPSWEPYSNESLRASEPFARYVQRADVQAELGKDFIKDKDDADSSQAKKKQVRFREQ